ncbi:MAG TPA: HAD family hydrolase [Gammaproteobacteria bacterium]|nr:HAD family hydrolase [Gammaproteobacteria bacterium]
MYFLALATDYDETLAHGGIVDEAPRAALARVKSSGRRLFLVTGRQLPDLESVFGDLSLFDRVVAENGALLYNPATREERLLAEPPPALFIERLKERRVEPLSVGRCIVATLEPEESAVLEEIHDLGLELQIIFNKGSVMVLPSGVNKATGLLAALADVGLSAHNVVAVGDAENDHALLRACGCGAAVANALSMLRGAADIVLDGHCGAGVVELVERLLRDEAALIPRRQSVRIGGDAQGREALLEPTGGSVLVAGQSGIGKSTLAIAFIEKIAEAGFEFCVLDPEGDYDALEPAVAVGEATSPPHTEEVLTLVERLGANVVVNTQALTAAERPAYFAQLLPRIASIRARTGRPHWLVVDEAHHLLPAGRGDVKSVLPEELPSVILITVHPKALSEAVLRTVRTFIAVGPHAGEFVAEFCGAAGLGSPPPAPRPSDDQILFWAVGLGAPYVLRAPEPVHSHQRHTRKYAEGNLGEDRSFYFRGPSGKLKLRAHNLMQFLEMAAGVDDATWDHHRQKRDYSEWFRRNIKDEELAREAEAIEGDERLDARQSRTRIAEAVRRRYTAPSAGDSI